MVKERVILGIDPGTIVMGYGVLLVLNNKPYLQTMGVLQLNNCLLYTSPSPRDS